MELFLLDIGNTNTRFGFYSGDGNILSAASIPTSELSTEILPENGADIAVASVVPDMNHLFDDFDPFFVSIEHVPFLDFSSLRDPSTLGADRIANAAALAKFADTPAICVDCGTAITIEGVDTAAGFANGPIAPGRGLLREALSSHTAQLPLAPLDYSKTGLPSVFSSDTEGAILAGCDVGALGMVREQIAHARLWPGFSDSGVYLAGGDSDYFAENIDDVRNVGADFTLLGIAAIFLEAAK